MEKANFMNSNKSIKKIDSDDAWENLKNYKGVFFGGDSETLYYEAGAHFQFNDLCRRLNYFLLHSTPMVNDTNKQFKTRENDNTCILNPVIKESIQSRNKKIVAGSNSLITAQYTRNIQFAQTNVIAKHLIQNNYINTEQTNNGFQNNINMPITNYKNNKKLSKQVKLYSKLIELNKKEEVKNTVFSNHNLDINKASEKNKKKKIFFLMNDNPFNKDK